MAYKPFKMKGSPMKRNFGVKSPNNLNNFGIGPGGSPWKEVIVNPPNTENDEEEEEEENKINEQGGDKETPDKPWVKLLKAGTTLLSGGIQGVYGGERQYPKINWGKRKKEEEVPDTETKVDNLINGNGESDKKSEGGTTYEIKSGNTLSQIAKDNNTTVEELMKKNPDIKDKNKIYAGNTINL